MRRSSIAVVVLAVAGTALLVRTDLYEAFTLPKRVLLLGLGALVLPLAAPGIGSAIPVALRRLLAGIVLAGLVSLVNASSRVVAAESLLYVIVIIGLVVVAHGAASSYGLRPVAWTIAAVAGVVALYGASQAAGFDPFFGDRPGQWAGSLVRRRTFSTVGSPTMLAEYLAIALPVTVALGLSARTTRERVGSVVVVALSVVSILATAARGPLVGLAIGPVLCAAALGKRTREVLGASFTPARAAGRFAIAAAIAFGTLVWAVLPGDREGPAARFAEIAQPTGSARARLEIWRATLEVARASLPFGAGIGCFDLEYLDARGRLTPPDPPAGTRERIVTVHAAHDDPLQVVAEMGVAGLALLFLAAWSLRALAREALSGSPDRAVAMGFTGTLAVGAGAALTGFPLHVPATVSVIAVALGSLAVRQGGPAVPARIPIRIAGFVLGIAALVMAVREGAAAALASEGARRITRDPETAEAIFERALAWQPESGVAALGLGRARMARRDWVGAEDALVRARKTHDDEMLPVHLGKTLLYQHRPAQAERVLALAVRRNPDRAIARTHLGEALLVQGKRREAIRQLRFALRLDPDEPIATHHLRMLEDEPRD